MQTIIDFPDHLGPAIGGDGSEESILLLEAVFILLKEPVKMMEEHPLEDGALGMPGPVDSCHGEDRNSKNGPKA